MYKLVNNTIFRDDQALTNEEIVNELNILEKRVNMIPNMEQQAFDILIKKCPEVSLEMYCYPQVCGSTNPFGCGGCAMTTFTVTAFVNVCTQECVLFLCGRPQYHEKFELCMRYRLV